ncbi:MAG: hypothetical protein JJE55_08065 [Flavobacteriaceae bacterium]|nr:hypothetical protein [Flavobacteriaceae bacterium]
METTIYNRLLMTQDDYEMMVMQIWLNWCGEKSKNHKTLQKVLTCVPLFNWWQRELQKLEAQFLIETQPFLNQIHAKRMYAEWTIEIFSKFSKPLLKTALKNE